MEKLGQILRSYVVGHGETDTKDKLLVASFLVLDKNGVLFSDTIGRLGLDPAAPPYTTDSMSYIASLTKLITSICLLQLVEEGLITLDEDLRPRVPELAAMQILKGFNKEEQPILEENKNPITLRHLLTHTVGLNYDLGDTNLIKWAAVTGRTVSNLEWCLEGFTTPLSFAPGEGWCYGTAIDWAGYLLQVVTGKKLGDYMEQHIFKPLGMTSTTFFPKKILDSENRRVEYFERGEDGSLRPCTFEGNFDNHQLDSGGAGLVSTPSDYGKMLLAIFQHKLISQETTEAMFTPQLNDVQAESAQQYVDLMPHVFVPEFPLEDGHVVTKLNHGLSGMMNMDDVPGKRRKGSLTWSGYTNGRWFIDPETGISVLLFTQVFPFADQVVIRLWDELEKVVYSDLLPEIRGSTS